VSPLARLREDDESGSLGLRRGHRIAVESVESLDSGTSSDFCAPWPTERLMKPAALLAVALVALSAASVPVAVAGTPKVSVAEVTVSPERPSPGERFTVTATLRNGESTPDSPSGRFDVNSVMLVRSGSGETLSRVTDLGTLPAGATLDVPLTTRFDVGQNGDDVISLRAPVVVTVSRAGPQLGIETDDAVVGAEGPLRVTVANGEDAPIRNVRLTLEGTESEVEDATRVVSSLAAGESREFVFNYTPGAPASDVLASLAYTTPGGNRRSVEESTAVDAEPLREDVTVEASAGDGASPPIEATVSNFGNAPLADVVVRAEADGSVLARRTLADVADGESRRVDLNVSDLPPDAETDVRVVAAYRTGAREGTAATTVRYAPNPGRVELTGVDFEYEGDRVHITGSASNVGLSDADGVVVRVLPGDGVQPARPYREYFVGTVPASDFVAFDLYAAVEPSATTVPVEVTYLVDGERRTTTQRLDVSDLPPPRSRSEGGDGGPFGLSVSLPLLVAGLLAVVVVLGLGAYAYSRR
jgi:hypothetical protein